MSKGIASVIILAIILQTIIGYVNDIANDKRIPFQKIISIILGVLFAISYNADLLSMLGLAGSVQYLGHIVTGILISGGSNMIYDILKQVEGIR